MAVLAADILRTSGSALAKFAAVALLEQHEDLRLAYGQSARARWEQEFRHLLDVLAVALRRGSPALFRAEIEWTAQALDARSVPRSHLTRALATLRGILAEELPAEGRAAALDIIDAVNVDDVPPPVEDPDVDSTSQRLALGFVLELLKGNRLAAIDLLLDAAARGASVRELFTDVLVRAQVEIGRLWHLDQIGVAEEHFATDTTRRAIAQLLATAPREPANGRTVLTAAVAHNPHDLATRMIGDLLELDGWRTIHLGGDVPATALGTAAQEFEADLVVLSAMLATHVDALEDAIRAIRLAQPDARIFVGGRALNVEPGLCERLGADVYAASIPDALAAAADVAAERTSD